MLKRERELLNAAVILYTRPPDAPWYFHPPIKASGAKGAKKGERPYARLIERVPYYRVHRGLALEFDCKGALALDARSTKGASQNLTSC